MDVVVTVPKNFKHPCAPDNRGLDAWIAEGDAAGEPWSGTEWDFYCGGTTPMIERGERVYIVCQNWLRGYAPLIRIDQIDYRSFSLVRGGDAVAVTIPQRIIGFRGFRYRWWDRVIEIPFPDWRIT